MFVNFKDAVNKETLIIEQCKIITHCYFLIKLLIDL